MIKEIFNSVDNICDLLKEAGASIMTFYRKSDLKVSIKDDKSSVTEADLASNKILCLGLSKMFTDVPIISEENSFEDNCKASKNDCFWLMDPLDGTENFIKGESSFTINLALIKDETPVMGFLYLPVEKRMYYGFDGKAFKKENNKVTKIQKSHNVEISTIVTSKRADKKKVEYIKNIIAPKALIIKQSSAQKFCSLVDGKADAFLCCYGISEWDIAAGHAIIDAMGGKMVSLGNKMLKYGDSDQNFCSQNFLAVRNDITLNNEKLKSVVDILR